MLRRARAGLIVVRHVLPATVAVNVRSNPVEVEQAMVATVGDHAAQLGVEPRDDRLGVRKRPADGDHTVDTSGSCRPCAAAMIGMAMMGSSSADGAVTRR